MNKKQWIVLGISLIIMGIFLVSFAMSCVGIRNEDMLIACYIQRYSYGIPALICFGLGIIFIILGFFEDKKKR